MKGAVLEKGQSYYTYLDEIFPALGGEHLKYNWLITDLECNNYPKGLSWGKDYIWLSGKELSDIVYKNRVQFIWGILLAFEQSVTLEDVLSYQLPYVRDSGGYWPNPISIAHPKAEIEIVPCDSSLVLLVSKDDILIEKFMDYFPLSEDLERYNARHE